MMLAIGTDDVLAACNSKGLHRQKLSPGLAMQTLCCGGGQGSPPDSHWETQTAEKGVSERKIKNLNMSQAWTRKIHEPKYNRDVSLSNSPMYRRIYLKKYTKQWKNRGAGTGVMCWGCVWIQPINFLHSWLTTNNGHTEGCRRRNGLLSSEKRNHMMLHIHHTLCIHLLPNSRESLAEGRPIPTPLSQH